MSNMPWFPFYVDDFMASPKVARMSMEEVGVYLLLLCQQHQEGAVEWPCERIPNALRGHEKSVEYVLSECFKKGQKGWQNERLSRIHAEQDARSEKARMAANARWNKDSDANADADAMQTQCERNANHNQNHNQKEETDTSKPIPVSDMWEAWVEVLGGEGRRPKLTAKRRQALKLLYLEHLKNDEDPIATFRRVLKAVLDSEHHMGTRAYQMPESLFRNEERRDRWVTVALNGNGNGKGKRATQTVRYY